MKKSKIKELKTITRETLNNILETIVSEDANCFEKGELAYIMLQEKAERQIRDKVAWKLQQALSKEKLQQVLSKEDDRLLVCMEWCPTDWKPTHSTKTPSVDLAVLYLNDKKTDYVDVLAMVEFKYYALLTDSEKADKTKNFKKDILKMKQIADLPSKNSRYSESDIYYVVLQGNHQCDSYSNNEHQYGVKYIYSNSQYNKVNSDPSHDFGRLVYECFDKYYNNTMGCEITTSEDLSKKGRKEEYPVVRVGESLGYSLQMSMMVWGPFYKDDYEVQ